MCFFPRSVDTSVASITSNAFGGRRAPRRLQSPHLGYDYGTGRPEIRQCTIEIEGLNFDPSFENGFRLKFSINDSVEFVSAHNPRMS